jgi:L-ascorbate metabolism protein UlaG (beta-lactamase superfamily)
MDFFVSIAIMYSLLYLLDRSLAATGYRGKHTDHFDGKYFYNLGDENSDRKRLRGSWKAFLRWMWKRPKNPWHWRENRYSATVPRRVDGKELLVTYVNHSTVLIQTAGLNILTDPIWSKRTSPLSFFGPKRFRAPGIVLDELPKIDIVLISHNHYDHMDVKSLRRLMDRDNPKIFTGLGNAKFMRRVGIKGTHDMDWWEKTSTGHNVSVVCVPAQHFSGRAISDRNRTLWCGFVVETAGGNIYFAGDTGYGPFVHELKMKYKEFRLALLPIGAFRPEWFMGPVHVSPDEAFGMHTELNVSTTVAIHHSTFKLADDKQDEPRQRIAHLLARAGDKKPNFIVPENGETLRI